MAVDLLIKKVNLKQNFNMKSTIDLHKMSIM